jgi:hypothetical protein
MTPAATLATAEGMGLDIHRLRDEYELLTAIVVELQPPSYAVDDREALDELLRRVLAQQQAVLFSLACLLSRLHDSRTPQPSRN